MFDHDHGVALFHEFVQHVQQLAHILEMQPRGGFVQDIQGATRGAAAQLLGQLHPLRLATRQRRGLLADLDIPKAHLHQRIHLFTNAWHRLEKALRVFDRHIKNIGNAFVLELYFQSLAVIARAFARLTGNIDIGQEMHLDLDQTIALAGLAAAALDVEAEPTRLISARLCFRQTGEPVTDRGEGPGIGRRVRAGRAADGALINVDDLVQMLEPLDGFAGCGGFARAVQARGGGLEQGFDGQGRFPAAGNAGNADELAQREISGDVLQVVAGSPDHCHLLAAALAPGAGNGNLSCAGQVLPGQAGRISRHLRRCAVAYHLPAMHTRPRTHIEHIIRLADRILVMFHHQNGVPLIAQVLQRGQQPVIVALMQADRRLVQHIKHPGQAGPDLAGQPDALRFPARQRAGIARQRQVIQPDIHQEPKTLADFLKDGAGDLVLLRPQRIGHRADPDMRLGNRHLNHLPRMQPGDLYRQRLGFQAVAVARATGTVVLVAFEFLPHPGGIGFAVAPFHIRDDAFEDAGYLIDAPAFVIAERNLCFA